jgi:hypothetical protein
VNEPWLCVPAAPPPPPPPPPPQDCYAAQTCTPNLAPPSLRDVQHITDLPHDVVLPRDVSRKDTINEPTPTEQQLQRALHDNTTGLQPSTNVNGSNDGLGGGGGALFGGILGLPAILAAPVLPALAAAPVLPVLAAAPVLPVLSAAPVPLALAEGIGLPEGLSVELADEIPALLRLGVRDPAVQTLPAPLEYTGQPVGNPPEAVANPDGYDPETTPPGEAPSIPRTSPLKKAVFAVASAALVLHLSEGFLEIGIPDVRHSVVVNEIERDILRDLTEYPYLP